MSWFQFLLYCMARGSTRTNLIVLTVGVYENFTPSPSRFSPVINAVQSYSACNGKNTIVSTRESFVLVLKNLLVLSVFTLSVLMTGHYLLSFFPIDAACILLCVNQLILSPCQAVSLISRLRFSKNSRAFLRPKQTNATFCLPNYVHNVRISQWIF